MAGEIDKAIERTGKVPEKSADKAKAPARPRRRAGPTDISDPLLRHEAKRAAVWIGIAGLVVNTAMSAGQPAARWLFAIFAVLAAMGFVVAYRASRGAGELVGGTA